MASIDDPSPPPPKRYIENEIESGDGRAAVQASSLQTSKGGLAETRKNAGGR
jgi:hypothetical protein